MTYEIKLDIFEGPLDLLLTLIKKNDIDIYNIPIAVITEQYLQHVEAMKALNLDIAGEYLVMASTLILIKSKMLLPVDESEAADQEAEDPRAELVRQLLEYQAFKEAAATLETRPILGRDVFKRDYPVEESESADDEEGVVELDLFDLIQAFRKVLSGMKKEEMIEFDLERISLSDRISEIMDRLNAVKDLTFDDLLEGNTGRRQIVYTFLAILELMKLKAIRVFQVDPFGTIRVFPAVDASPSEDLSFEEASGEATADTTSEGATAHDGDGETSGA